ncbi:hypothetical protein C8A01DRAFT_19370 [Parachaetomium inaequale]|uniref:Uncharacterized protein n=1 Tax=Parachaetomium inaequale TaxID=2588326 RepID=A0AAN6SMC6_9PEZI|nr:hypothetical protein C8A01DRAFT_19370 [Parachaetomium inaequale]
MPPLPNRDFHFFPVPDVPVNLPSLTLTNTTTWTYCGPLLPLSDSNPPSSSEPEGFPETFHSWSSHTFSGEFALLPRLTPFLRAVHAFLLQHGTHHYWLTVRASKPTADFNAPRWHTDDHFFDPPRSDEARGQWKLCGTLQGPGTLFAEDGAKARRKRPHVCTVVGCAACGRTSEAVREEVRVALEGEGVVQPGNGEMAFFRLGGREGAVHSEPRIECDRVFVNVVPGTEAELRGLMGRWGMEFPRSWSLGVPAVVGMTGCKELDAL